MGGLFETSTIKGELKNIYNKQEVLDYNVYGVTHKCKEAKTNNIVALKIIDKKYLEKVCGEKNLDNSLDIIRQEIETLKKMNGDYSLRLIDGTETIDSFYIITEIWDTNLENYILDRKKGLNFDEIKEIFNKLNIAFKRMEENKIIHENLNTKDILIRYNKNEIIPLLSGYGKKYNLDEKLNIMQTTSQFSSPELLIGEEYDYKVDLWSIGIILYRLYYNEFPFNGETQAAIFNDIKKKKNFIKCEENYYFNDLIKKLLVVDPNYRMNWEDYFNHKFWESDKNEVYKDNKNKKNEAIENENIEKEKKKRKEFKFLYKKNKNSLKNKYYNVYYCLNNDNNINNINNINNENQNEEIDKKNNFDEPKKIEIMIDKNNKELIENLIYTELINNVPTENLTKLILYGCNMNNIDILKNIKSINLLELDLSRNQINNIEPLSNVSYVNLISLNLSNNIIHDISPLIKVPFNNLQNLNLAHNLISDINPLSQVPFYNLDKLKLSSNKIRDIDIFMKVPFVNLTSLDLKNNKISDAAKALAFISINNLLSLDLSHNSIKTLEGLNTNKYYKLINLELGDNNISNIDILKEVYFNELVRLSLADNNIDNGNIFAEVPFNNLKELNLSYNNIENIDFINYVVFQNLEKLDLNGNKINDLTPLNQLSLNNLKELELKNNKLKENENNDIILNNLKMKNNDLKCLYN